jgi:hypothetical protein
MYLKMLYLYDSGKNVLLSENFIGLSDFLPEMYASQHGGILC